MDAVMHTSTYKCDDTIDFINTIIKFKEIDYNTLLLSKHVCLATKYDEQIKIYVNEEEEE